MTEAPGAHAYDLPQLIDNVLRGKVMKTASATRGALVITKARCLDCHKFGDKGAGLGPDLTTVNSRFRPAEIVESIVQPSKVISDQYKSVTLATQDGKVYAVVSDSRAESSMLVNSHTSFLALPLAGTRISRQGIGGLPFFRAFSGQ